MSTPVPSPMTPEEYLVWEDQQERPWEFDGFQPVAMNGGTWAHSLLAANVLGALRAALRGSKYQANGPHVRVPTGRGRYRYPDVLVVCTPVSAKARDVPDPVVLVEILSEGTAEEDRTTKLSEYLSMPSVQHYVMMEQFRPFAIVISRDGPTWRLAFDQAGGTIALAAVGVTLDIDLLYEGVL